MTEQSQEQKETETPAAESAADLPVGEQLRQAREARGESVADIARALKLTARQVEAMETARFDLLPGAAFARGFMRNYARHLQIDIDAALAHLQFGGDEESAKLAPVANARGVMPDTEERRKAYGPIAMTVAVLMLVIFFLGWYFDGFRVSESRPGPMSETPAAVRNAAPVQPERTHVTVVTPPAPVSAVETIDTTEPENGAAGNEAQGLEDSTPQPASSENAVSAPPVEPTQTASVETAPAVAEEPSESAAVQGGQLVFSLKEASSWIQVRDSKGAMLYSGTDARGTTRKVQGTPPFSVVVGNSSNVSLEFNGRSVDLTPHMQASGVARLTVQ